MFSIRLFVAFATTQTHFIINTMPNDTQTTQKSLAPLIAVIGCDGSGKSTLTAELIQWLGENHPVGTAYLGNGSGRMGNKIKTFPLIGRPLERVLSRKAKQARKKGGTIPGFMTAFVIFLLSLMRYRRFCRMMKMRQKGIMIITDRYPQIEVPGFFDGPGLSAARAGSSVVRFLVEEEYKLYEKMVDQVPDLVLRLNVSVETAFARKPDHNLDQLKAKAAVAPLLQMNGARIVDLDAEMDYSEELALAKKAITEMLSSRMV